MSIETINDAEKEELDDILQQIDDEYEKQRVLKAELKKINAKIYATHLASRNNDENLKKQLFYASVKIFNDIIDLVEFYGDDIRGQMGNLLEKDKDFYVVDLKWSQLLQDHVLTKKWRLNINITDDELNSSMNRSINFKNNQSNQILNVIPVEKGITTKTVRISLEWPNLDFSPTLTLAPIEIDISYHFRTYNPAKMHGNSSNTKAPIEIDEDDDRESTCRIVTGFSQQKLFEVLLENSYHRLDISSIIDEQKIQKLQFMVNNNLVQTEFNCETTELKLEAKSSLLEELKIYLYKKMLEIEADLEKCKRDLEAGILDLKQLKKIYG